MVDPGMSGEEGGQGNSSRGQDLIKSPVETEQQIQWPRPQGI